MATACSPVPDYEHTSPYGWRGGKFHHGIDLFAPAGTVVRSAQAGVVEASVASGTPGFNRYGETIIVKHAEGTRALYAHLGRRQVALGARVKRGSVLGTVGTTAGTVAEPGAHFERSGPHLHWEILVSDYPASVGGPRFVGDTEDVRTVDPVTWLAQHSATLRSKCDTAVNKVAAGALGAGAAGLAVFLARKWGWLR